MQHGRWLFPGNQNYCGGTCQYISIGPGYLCVILPTISVFNRYEIIKSIIPVFYSSFCFGSGTTDSKTRKFVASEVDLAKAADDFSEAVGGAKEGGTAKPIVTAAMRKSDKPQDQGPTTSRLLDAKRRAQQRMEEKED